MAVEMFLVVQGQDSSLVRALATLILQFKIKDKSVKLSELDYNVTRNDFLNRGTLRRHVGTDVTIFWLPSIFLKPYLYVNLYNVGTAI